MTFGVTRTRGCLATRNHCAGLLADVDCGIQAD
jgi:hypothetical protein